MLCRGVLLIIVIHKCQKYNMAHWYGCDMKFIYLFIDWLSVSDFPFNGRFLWWTLVWTCKFCLATSAKCFDLTRRSPFMSANFSPPQKKDFFFFPFKKATWTDDIIVLSARRAVNLKTSLGFILRAAFPLPLILSDKCKKKKDTLVIFFSRAFGQTAMDSASVVCHHFKA